MFVSGLLDCKTVTGSVNGEAFYNFIQTALLPHLMPFDGQNPNSVVVMDNASIHHDNKTDTRSWQSCSFPTSIFSRP